MSYIDDMNLSLRAKGIMAFIENKFGKQDQEINFSLAMIESKEGRDAKRNALNELIRAGYIKQETKRNQSGQIIGTACRVFF